MRFKIYLVQPPAILAPYNIRVPPKKAEEGAIPTARPRELDETAEK